jgi:1-acyl-sn-glycerol-3-phosphate acyltransferase
MRAHDSNSAAGTGVSSRPSTKGSTRARGPLALARYAIGFVGTVTLALAFDVWLRFGIVWRYRNNEDRKIRSLNRLVRHWGTSIFWVAHTFLGLRLRVEGTIPSTGRYLIISNHQSSLDIPLLISLFRSQNLKFVAMEELRYGKPVISLALRHGGFALVSEKKLGDDLAALTRFAHQLERVDGSPVIFPEGWLARDGELRKFNFAGIETVRRVSRLPIVTVTIDGLWKAPSIEQYLRIYGDRITVRITEPVPFNSDDLDRRKAYGDLEETIRRNLEEIRAQ